MRPLLGLLLALSSLSAVAQTPIKLQLRPPFDIEEDLRSTWRLLVINRSPVPEEVRMYISVAGATTVEVPDICAIGTWGGADCAFTMPAKATREITFVTRSFRRFDFVSVVAHATGKSEVAYEVAVFGREYFVTTTADSGAGSLRQAMLDVNAACEGSVPCVIRFAIDGPVPAEGWFTIAPLSPLPEMQRYVAIAGGTQSAPVLLDGRAAGEGNGLTFRGGGARVSDLAIGGFRGNGIDAYAVSVNRCFIGVDPTGLAALPNTGRGVMVNGGAADVNDSVIGGNGRAGAFFWTAQSVKVAGSFIGTGIDGATPVPNGASGLFFHKPSVSHSSGYAVDNVIGNNGHAGIGLSLTATGDFSRNHFRDNGAGAIDVGLDGPTRATITGNPGFGGVIGIPVITSARFENGVTTITGRNAPRAGSLWAVNRVAIFAGKDDVQELIATTVQFDFTVTIPRDLRGQAIRAVTFTTYVYNWDDPAAGTSEMSDPRGVE